jgi:phosphonoacetaldehyde hydrolase
MGAHKREHAREILHYPEVVERVRQVRGQGPDEPLLDEIYAGFVGRLHAKLPANAKPIPGAVATLHWLRERGVRVGSTTGYTRPMMEVLLPAAAAAGIEIEALICADEVVQGRPAPWACFRLAERFGVYPMSQCVKLGDTPADVAEGLNAGMTALAVSETGNEVGRSYADFAALSPEQQDQLVAAAAQRLREAGAHAVLRSVAELPSWLERRRD